MAKNVKILVLERISSYLTETPTHVKQLSIEVRKLKEGAKSHIIFLLFKQ